MHLKRFTNPQKFYDYITPALSLHEAENNLLFGVTNDVINGIYDANKVYMACMEHDGYVVLVALRTGEFIVNLSYLDANFDYLRLQAAESIVNDLIATYGPAIPGVNGVKDVVHDFIAVWAAHTGQGYVQDMAQRIYKLEVVKPVKGVAGTLRYATEADRELLVQWVDHFNREALNVGSNLERARQVIGDYFKVDNMINGLMVWEVAGEVVSMAGYKGPTPHGMRVGLVYTPPELRGRGYASACVAALSQCVLDMGRQFCFLFTDLANPTSNRIYQAIGYEAVCDCDRYRFIPAEAEAQEQST